MIAALILLASTASAHVCDDHKGRVEALTPSYYATSADRQRIAQATFDALEAEHKIKPLPKPEHLAQLRRAISDSLEFALMIVEMDKQEYATLRMMLRRYHPEMGYGEAEELIESSPWSARNSIKEKMHELGQKERASRTPAEQAAFEAFAARVAMRACLTLNPR